MTVYIILCIVIAVVSFYYGKLCGKIVGMEESLKYIHAITELSRTLVERWREAIRNTHKE